MVKGRNEPCRLIEVLDAVSAILKINKLILSQHAYNNACKIFKITNSEWYYWKNIISDNI